MGGIHETNSEVVNLTASELVIKQGDSGKVAGMTGGSPRGERSDLDGDRHGLTAGVVG